MTPRSWVTPGTATLIRDFLLEVGEAYPRQIHKFLKAKIEEMGYHPPTYNSVRKLLYALHRLGLIKRVRIETVKENPTAFKRVYYAVVKKRVKDRAWENPTTAAYYPEKFREQRKWPKPKPEEWMKQVRAQKVSRF